ncbi:MAG: cupin domain-containing protein [Bacteroidota bacterium]
MENNLTFSRRDLVQKLALLTGGAALVPFTSCQQPSPKGNEPAALKMLTPFYLPPQSPLEPGPGGIAVRTWVRSTQTNQQYSCVETAVAPKQMGPAPHMHDALDEIMLVLEGTATVIVDGKVDEIQAGGWHLRPRKIEHTFWNGSDKPLRFIDMYFNQNFEDFLEELFHQIFPDMMKQHLTPADPQIAKRLADLDKRFGVTTFGEKRQPLIDKYGLRG